jgi:GNAT superfamily N-acetyltransferase
MMEDTELARRSVTNFGEIVAAVGRCGAGEASVIRRPNAVGARIERAAESPWLNAAVVPFGATPPRDEPALPHCVWTVADSVEGRTEIPKIAMPCMGVELAALASLATPDAPVPVEVPPFPLLGELNDRAYGQQGLLGPLLGALHDDRVQAYGLRDGASFVCVALSLRLGDDLGIHYVATELSHRRRGLAGRLLIAMMAAARASGIRTATLQASPDGLPVYTRLGFRHVSTLRAFVRPRAAR